LESTLRILVHSVSVWFLSAASRLRVSCCRFFSCRFSCCRFVSCEQACSHSRIRTTSDPIDDSDRVDAACVREKESRFILMICCSLSLSLSLPLSSLSLSPSLSFSLLHRGVPFLMLRGWPLPLPLIHRPTSPPHPSLCWLSVQILSLLSLSLLFLSCIHLCTYAHRTPDCRFAWTNPDRVDGVSVREVHCHDLLLCVCWSLLVSFSLAHSPGRSPY
jgi:hypothetical protein